MIVILTERGGPVSLSVMEQATLVIRITKAKVLVLKDRNSNCTGTWPIEDLSPLIKCRIDNEIYKEEQLASLAEVEEKM